MFIEEMRNYIFTFNSRNFLIKPLLCEQIELKLTFVG